MNEKFSDERISAYLDDELSADVRADVERELVENADLRQAVDELRALRAGLQSLPRYRLETSIAERVLQLAEREILLGAGTDDKPPSIPFGGSASATSNPARPVADGAEPALLRASSPSHSAPVPSRSSAGDGRFSWRTLVWSASAAAIAAMITNYYHTNNLPYASGDRVAMAEKGAQEDKQSAARPAAGRDSNSAPALAAELAKSQSAVAGEAAEAAAAAKDATASTRAQVEALNANAIPDQPASDTVAGNVRGEPESRAGRGGMDRANSSAGEGQGGGGHAAGDLSLQNDPNVSFVYLEVSPEAWQDRAFDKLLEANRVMLLGDANAAEGAALRSTAADKSIGGSRSQDAPRNNRPGSDSATRRGKEVPPGSEMFMVDLTQEQFNELLAAVDQRSNEFAREAEFDVALGESEDANRGRFALGGGNAPMLQDTVDGAPDDAPGSLEALHQNDRPATPPRSFAQGALEATDPSSNGKQSAAGARSPSGFGARGGPLPKADRAEKSKPGAAETPHAATPAPEAAITEAAIPESVMPDEKAKPPKDAQQEGDNKRAIDKGLESAAGSARRSIKPKAGNPDAGRAAPNNVPPSRSREGKRAEEKSADGDPEYKKHEEKPQRTEDVVPQPPASARPADAPRAAPAEKPGDEAAIADAAPAGAARSAPDRSNAEPAKEQGDSGLPPAGFARRMPPRSDATYRDAVGALRQRRGSTEPTPPSTPNTTADAPAQRSPEAPVESALGDPAASGESPQNTPNRNAQPGVEADDAAAKKSLVASPRVRVIFLLRPTYRAPSAADLAAPGDASEPAAPAPSTAAPAADAPPVPANPR